MEKSKEIAEMVGLRLKTVRLSRGMSQEEFSQLLSMGRSLYTKYETGVAMPTCIKLWQIVETLGVSADYLLGFKDEKR